MAEQADQGSNNNQLVPIVNRIINREVTGQPVFKWPNNPLDQSESARTLELDDILDVNGHMKCCVFLGFTRDGNHLLSYSVNYPALDLQLWQIGSPSRLISNCSLELDYLSDWQPMSEVKLKIYESTDSSFLIVYATYDGHDICYTKIFILPGPAAPCPIQERCSSMNIPSFFCESYGQNSPVVIELDDGAVAFSYWDTEGIYYAHCKWQTNGNKPASDAGWIDQADYRLIKSHGDPGIENQSIQFNDEFDFEYLMKRACWTLPQMERELLETRDGVGDEGESRMDDDDDEEQFLDYLDRRHNIDIDNKCIHNLWMTKAVPTALKSWDKLRWWSKVMPFWDEDEEDVGDRSRYIVNNTTMSNSTCGVVLRFPARGIYRSPWRVLIEKCNTVYNNRLYICNYNDSILSYGHVEYHDTTVGLPSLPIALPLLHGQKGVVLQLKFNFSSGRSSKHPDTTVDMRVYSSVETGLSYLDYVLHGFDDNNGGAPVTEEFLLTAEKGGVRFVGCDAAPREAHDDVLYSAVPLMLNNKRITEEDMSPYVIKHPWLPLELRAVVDQDQLL